MKLLGRILLVTLVIGGCLLYWWKEPGVPYISPPWSQPSPPTSVPTIDVDPQLAQAPGVTAVPFTPSSQSAWVGAGSLAAHRQELATMLAHGGLLLVVGDGLNWDSIHRDLGLRAPARLVGSSQPLTAVGIQLMDRVPHYFLVQGKLSDEQLARRLLQAETWLHQGTNSANTGAGQPDSYQPLGGFVTYEEEPPYGMLLHTGNWYWAPAAPGSTSYAVVDFLFWTDGRAANTLAGDTRYGRRNYLHALGVGYAAAAGTVRAPTGQDPPCGAVQVKHTAGPLSWEESQGSFLRGAVSAKPHSLRWDVLGTFANSCTPRWVLINQGNAHPGAQIVVAGSRAPVTYTHSLDLTWGPLLVGMVRRHQDLTWQLTPPAPSPLAPPVAPPTPPAEQTGLPDIGQALSLTRDNWWTPVAGETSAQRLVWRHPGYSWQLTATLTPRPPGKGLQELPAPLPDEGGRETRTVRGSRTEYPAVFRYSAQGKGDGSGTDINELTVLAKDAVLTVTCAGADHFDQLRSACLPMLHDFAVKDLGPAG